MKNAIQVGDLCESVSGRDKGNNFLVVAVEGKFAYTVDGKLRKTDRPKKKNLKHLKRIEVAGLKSLATEIKEGRPVGNLRLYKQIKALTKK